jgi:hypothetical protein
MWYSLRDPSGVFVAGITTGWGNFMAYPGRSTSMGFGWDGALTWIFDSSSAALLSGTGTASLNFTARSGVQIDAFGQDLSRVTFNNTTEMGLDGTVTYHYTPVPEASSVALFAVGGLVLLLRRRR